MDYDGLLKLVKERRSRRRFKPDPIPDDYIHRILDVARWAPSGFNLQPWEFVVVKREDLRKKICESIGAGFGAFAEMEQTREAWQGRKWDFTDMSDEEGDYTVAPVFIILYGDSRTKAGLPMITRYDAYGCNMIWMATLANAFLYIHLAATTLGLATQWLSIISYPYAHCMVKDLLGIPHYMEVFDMVALGYPAIEPPKKFMRDLDDMVHYDDCGEDDFRSEEEMRDFTNRARSWNIGIHSKKAEANPDTGDGE
ncbi:MAG: nitroreductase family protein [Deltaproteobacteria bacterium]|nr:nitroreductase family protein [Deltaproteobacteria bacterium]